MAKYELTNGNYHISSGARVPKYGINIINLENNENTNFYIVPTTIDRKKNSKLSDKKQLVLDCYHYIHQKDISDNDFSKIISLARQLAINIGYDLIVPSNISKMYHITNQIVFKNLRLPMTFDEIKQMEEIEISPRLKNGIYWNTSKNFHRCNFMLTLESNIPKNIKTKINFDELMFYSYKGAESPINICVLDDNKNILNDFSNIEIKNIYKINKINLITSNCNILSNIKFPQCHENVRYRKRLQILNDKGIKENISFRGLKESMKNNNSIPVFLDLNFRYSPMITKLIKSQILSCSKVPPLPFNDRINMIYENIKESNNSENFFYSMKEFSELKELFENKLFQELYSDEFNEKILYINHYLPKDMNEIIKYYNENKIIFEEVLKKAEHDLDLSKKENEVDQPIITM